MEFLTIGIPFELKLKLKQHFKRATGQAMLNELIFFIGFYVVY